MRKRNICINSKTKRNEEAMGQRQHREAHFFLF